jgi:hypothetical protein
MEKSAAEQALVEYFATTWKSEKPTSFKVLEELRKKQPLAHCAFEYAWSMTMLYAHPHAKEISKTLGDADAAVAWQKEYRAQNLERLAYEVLKSLEAFEFPPLP